MPTRPSQNAARPSGTGDMFLYVKGARAGVIKGEAVDSKHKDEIEVLSWSWGLKGRSSFDGGTATGRSTMRELTISKKFDKASTALMSALRTNEPIKQAVLTLRKIGEKPLEFLKITIEDGRITSLDINAGDEDGSADVLETVTFSFNKIQVDYTPQGQDGQPLGSTSFQDEWSASA